jgi:uncharacterized RDD family membrane protein YckC
MQDVPSIDTPSFHLASRGKRLKGSLIDGFVAFPFTFLFFSYTGVLDQLANQEPMTGEQALLVFLFHHALLLILNGYLLTQYGQTIGKRLVGTCIVGLDGAIVPFNRLYLFRYVVSTLIFQIPLVGIVIALANPLFIFRQDHRCIHDHIAQTQVIDVN